MGFRFYADLGNTTLHLGLWQDGWRLERRVRTDTPVGDDGWRNALLSAASDAGLVGRECGGALISASTPRRTALADAISDAFGVRPGILGWDVSVEIPVQYDDPSTFGQDRLLAAFAAQELIGRPCVVLDAGTCITCDALPQDGALLPIAIAPGLPALAAGLHELTPHLSEAVTQAQAIGLAEPPLPARSTTDCVKMGLVSSLAGTAERLIAAALAVLKVDSDVPVVVTGGDAELIARQLRAPVVLAPLLHLDGLRLLDESATRGSRK